LLHGLQVHNDGRVIQLPAMAPHPHSDFDSILEIISGYVAGDLIVRPLSNPRNFLLQTPYIDSLGCVRWLEECALRVNREFVPTLLHGMYPSRFDAVSPFAGDWEIIPGGTVSPVPGGGGEGGDWTSWTPLQREVLRQIGLGRQPRSTKRVDVLPSFLDGGPKPPPPPSPPPPALQ
jgi:hypothetical protein